PDRGNRAWSSGRPSGRTAPSLRYGVRRALVGAGKLANCGYRYAAAETLAPCGYRYAAAETLAPCGYRYAAAALLLLTAVREIAGEHGGADDAGPRPQFGQHDRQVAGRQRQ